MYTVVATVTSTKGECSHHQVGDQVVYRGRSIEGSFCPSAMVGLMSVMYAMRYGAEFPWSDSKDTTSYACPDPHNPVVFEVRRIPDGG